MNSLIREYLSYDPATGVLRWLKSPGASLGRAGKIAGCIERQPRREGAAYCRIRLNGTPMAAHRIAWLLMTGDWPEKGLEIDHIDGNGLNNCWSNLRCVPHSTNLQNLKKAMRHNSTGLLGVTKQDGRFVARIHDGRRRICLGHFSTADQAHQAYLEAKRKLHIGNTL